MGRLNSLVKRLNAKIKPLNHYKRAGWEISVSGDGVVRVCFVPLGDDLSLTLADVL